MSREAFEDAIYDCLTALAGVMTQEIDLRDHPGAWQAIEAFAAVVQADAYERAAKIARGEMQDAGQSGNRDADDAARRILSAIEALAKESNS
jgi:hypothetical protein